MLTWEMHAKFVLRVKYKTSVHHLCPFKADMTNIQWHNCTTFPIACCFFQNGFRNWGDDDPISLICFTWVKPPTRHLFNKTWANLAPTIRTFWEVDTCFKSADLSRDGVLQYEDDHSNGVVPMFFLPWLLFGEDKKLRFEWFMLFC